MPTPPTEAPKVEEKSTKKADHPHWLPIGLSITAIVVSLSSAYFSYQSLQETRENRKISEITARAYVRVASALIDTRALYPHENVKFKRAIAYIVVTNTGKAAAKNLRVQYAMLEQNQRTPSSRVDGSIGRAAHFRDMAPGASETIRFGIPVLVKGKRLDFTDRQFTIDVTLIYNDGIRPGDKVEGTLMCGGKPDKPEGGLVTLYYCVNLIEEFDKDRKPPQALIWPHASVQLPGGSRRAANRRLIVVCAMRVSPRQQRLSALLWNNRQRPDELAYSGPHIAQSCGKAWCWEESAP